MERQLWEEKLFNLIELLKHKNYNRIANQKLQNLKPSEVKAIMEKESNLTFKPRINKISDMIAQKKKRYRFEESYGEKKETYNQFDLIEELYYKEAVRKHNIKKQQELKEERELEECTFTPEINRRSRSTQKEISCYPSSEQFERIKEEQEYKKGIRKELKKISADQREQEELKECTFHPKINEFNPSVFRESAIPTNYEKEVNRMRIAFFDKLEKKMKLTEIPRGENYEYYRNLPINPPKCAMNYIIRDEEPFLYLDVNIGKNKTGRIGLKENDDPLQKARNFAVTFQLNQDMEHGLASLLEEQLRFHWAEKHSGLDIDTVFEESGIEQE